MNAPRPSLARQAGVIATAILATALTAIAAIGTYVLWEKWFNGSTESLGWLILRDLPAVPAFAASYCAGTALASPLLLRVARLTKMWHAALLAAIALGVSFGVFRDDPSRFLDLAEKIFPPSTGFPCHFLLTYTLPQAVTVALGSVLYRAMRPRDVPEDSPAHSLSDSPSPSGHRPRFGTRAELRTLCWLLASLVLLLGGGSLIIREYLLRQIPSPVWAALRQPKEMTLLLLDSDGTIKDLIWPKITPTKFHGTDVVGNIPVTSADDQAIVANYFKENLLSPWRSPHGFLGGPYGLRVTDGASTYDFVFWPDNNRIVVYEGDTVLSEMKMRVMPGEIRTLLRAAGVTIPGLFE